MTKCNPFKKFGSRDKRPFDKDEMTLVESLRAQNARILRAANSTEVARSRIVRDKIRREELANEWIDSTGDVIRLLPEQQNRLMDFLITQFGQKARFLGLDPQRNYTRAGEVRYNLETFQGVAEGMINIAGRIESLKKIRFYNETLKRVTKGKNLTSHQKALLSLGALEEGRIPQRLSNTVRYRTTELGMASNPVHVFLKKRYEKFVRDAEDMGFSTEEINELINASTELSTVFDEVRAAARALGVDVPELENLGYFSRIVTRDFKERLKDVDVVELFSTLKADIVDLSSAFSRSRKTVHYIPYDTELAAKILGVSADDLSTMLDNPRLFRDYLAEELTTDQLDTLIDAGLFEKLPMSSREVYDYFVSQYEFPYKSITQMFVTNPEEALKRYASSLQQAAGASGLVRGIMDGRSFSAGWTVDIGTVNADKKRYANFIPIGDTLDRWAAQANVTPSQALVNLGLASSADVADEMVSSFKNAYVHPIVARQWSAIMDISINPALMSNVGFIIYKTGRVFNKLGIGSNSLGYILNSLGGNIINTFAAGGNLLRFVPAMFDVIKALKTGFDTFDNSRVYFTDQITGKNYTRRQLIREFMKHRGQGYAPGVVRMPYTVSTTNSFVKELLDTPAAVFQAVHDILTYTMAQGNPVNGKTIPLYERPGRFARASLLKAADGLDAYFGNLMFATSIMEIAAKLTTLESILIKDGTREAASAVGQVFTSFQFTRFDNLDEAFRHLDEYFVNQYSVGKATATLGAFVFPFAIWRMSNPPMQIRHAIRHPQWYMSYARLQGLNQESLSQDERAVEAAIEPWVMDSYPWYIGRDKRGQPMMLMPGSFDPIADGMIFFKDTADTVGRMLGMKARRAANARQDARNETVSDFLNGYISSTFFPIRGVYEMLAGVDTFTGKKIDDNPAEGYPDFWGINLPPRVVLLLQKIPVASKIDVLNPGGTFGRAGRFDVTTGEMIEAPRPSIFGGSRSRRDSRAATFENAPLWTQIGMLAGLNIRTIDYDRNLQNTYADIDGTIGYLEQSINTNRTAIVSDFEKGKISRKEFDRRAAVIRNQTTVWGQLLIDKMRLGSYMKQYNVTPSDVLKELDRKGMQVRDLPLPGDEQLDEIAKKVLAIDAELDRIEKGVGNE